MDLAEWQCYALDIDSDENAYSTQLQAVQDALKTYGTDHIEGVSHSNSLLVRLTWK